MWLGTIIALAAVVAFFTVVVATLGVIRRSRARKEPQLHTDFTIDELRRLRMEGKLSAEEFAKARKIVLARGQPAQNDSGTGGFEVILKPPDDGGEPRA